MSLSLNLSTFHAQFPGYKSDKDGKAIEYTVADSTYRIYNPTVVNASTWNIELNHDRGGATDDQIFLTVSFNADATLNSVAYSWKTGNDGYQIPDGFIKAVDITLDILAVAGGVVSAGTATEIIESAKEAFDTCAELFNDVSAIVVKWSDGGGRFYFIPVACHTVNRLCTAVSN